MRLIFFILLGIHLIISLISFRYQRTTLGICRILFGENNPNVQVALTPPWMGSLGWLSTILVIILATFGFFLFGWIWAGVILIYGFGLIGLLDVFTPIPSYKWCFKIIKGTLKKDINNPKLIHNGDLITLLDQVEEVERDFLNKKVKLK